MVAPTTFAFGDADVGAVEAAHLRGARVDVLHDADVAVQRHGVAHRVGPPGLQDHRGHEIADHALQGQREHETAESQGTEQRAHPHTEDCERVRQADEEHGVADEARGQDGGEALPDAASHNPAQNPGDSRGQDRRADQHDPGLDPVAAGQWGVQQRLAVGLGQHGYEIDHQRPSLSCTGTAVDERPHGLGW